MNKDELLEQIKILEDSYDYAEILVVYLKHIIKEYDNDDYDDLSFEIQEIIQQYAIPRYKLETLKNRIEDLNNKIKKSHEVSESEFEKISERIKSKISD